MASFSLFSLLFIFMFLSMPIAVSLGLSSILTIFFFSDNSLSSIALKLFETVSEHYTLLAIPFFILSSTFLSTGGVAKRLIKFSVDVVGHVRGGLAMGSVMACMMFAAVSGSSPATVAAIGTLVIAGMVRSGYPEKFAAGVITNAGTLGILIPPSIVMLVYASATEVSAATLFMAGLIPGLLMGGILMLAIYIAARIMDLPRDPWPGFKMILQSGLRASGGLLMIVIVLGSIYGGIASPTEAAAVSAVYSFWISVFIYRDIGPMKSTAWREQNEPYLTSFFRNIIQSIIAIPKCLSDEEVRKAIMDASKVSIMLLFIIANAMLFAHVLTTERIPHAIAEQIIIWGLEPWMFLVVVNLLLLAAGNFMEPSAIILIMAPILFPIATKMGIDPIHLGIIMVVNMEIGMLTPPVGLNLFVTAGITGRSMGWVIKAASPWLLLLLIFLIMITYIPQISLFLPEFIDSLRGF
ncbi:MAG: TRAP transporter large permease subunit [Gammaproteobacteria bacterium]|nr:TRAP transporter large permease subunit [Gammaproteobacteria bacterium]